MQAPNSQIITVLKRLIEKQGTPICNNRDNIVIKKSKNGKSQIGNNYAIRILKAPYIAIEQIFVAQILYFSFV